MTYALEIGGVESTTLSNMSGGKGQVSLDIIYQIPKAVNFGLHKIWGGR